MKAVNKVNWVSWLMHNYRLTFLLFALLFFAGFLGIDRMPKAEFPDFVIRQGIVAVVYPGATAEEVEVQVTRPLERYLFSFDEVKRRKTTSTSSNGLCTMLVELEDDVQNKDEVWSKIRHGLNDFKGQLPQGVMAVVVNDDFGDTSALLLALESEQRSYRELKRYADELSDELRRIQMVDKVTIYGEALEQISVYVDQERLAAYGLGKLQLMQGLQAAGMTTLSGSLTGWAKDVPIHVRPSVHSEEEIEQTVIYTDRAGRVVRVKDIAEVKREYDSSEQYIEYNDHPCLILSLEMLGGNNIVAFGEQVQQVIDAYVQTQLPADVTVQRITDQSQVVDDSVKDFLVNLIESMVIIVLVMLLLFPWRTAVVAGLIVPLNTFISVGIMYVLGIPLNIMTLAALIIVMGMVVDNAIVVLDGYLEYVEKGMSRWHAAAHSARHYFMPMALATLCLCAIFFPFLFTMTGQVKDMVFFLPWTIAINLVVSLLLAVGVIPLMEFAIIQPTAAKGDMTNAPKKKSITDYVQEIYDRCLAWHFRHPWLTIVGGVGLVVLSVALIGPRLKVRMLPTADRNQFAVEITLPAGKGLAETKEVADVVYAELIKEERVVSVTRFIGCSSPRFHTAYAPKGEGRNMAQFIVNTVSQKATEELLDQFEPMSDRFPNAFVKFKQLDYQNFTPFEYRFYGYDVDSLRSVAEQVMMRMRQDPRVMNVHTDWEEPRYYVDVELDDVRTARLGINRTLAQLELAAATGDLQVGQLWEEEFRVPLVLKERYKEELNSGEVNDLYLSAGNASVPLRQVGEAHPEWGATNIVHRNGMRCVTVGVEAKRGVYTNALQTHFVELIEREITLPHGIRFEVGGEPENDVETQEPLVAGLGIAVVAIFLFLLFNFKAYKLAFTSVAALLLCLPGALLGLWLMNRPMGVTAVFGFVTLMGMIMRNEILIFEHAKGLMRQGFTAREAAFDAGKRRMVPIFLTTATTAMGVVPMIVAATSFWMPVGVSICVGGIGSLIMVVTVLPVVFWKLYEK